MLFYGAADYVTLVNNYIHHCSGRAPKVGGSSGDAITMHAVNNYFYNIAGDDFDIGVGAAVLLEGNYFQSVTTPITAASSSARGSIFTTVSRTESSCTAYLGRACVTNAVSSSGTLPGYGTTAFLATIKAKESGYVPAAIAASSVPAYVVAHAGVGKL